MRLTCPNCEAQYEVPDDVIPAEGRDVQCSNCGDTWFQTSPNVTKTTTPEAPAPVEQTQDRLVEPTPEQAPPADQDPQDTADDQHSPSETPEHGQDPEPEVQPEPEAEPEPEPELEDADEDEPEFDTDPDDADAGDIEPEAPATEEHQPEAAHHTGLGLARGMDPSVTGILREEAEREAQLRAAESAVTDSHPRRGLDLTPEDESAHRAIQARDRMARMKGENPALLAATESGSRRGLLPDIEEINSTLRAGGDPAAAHAVAPDAQHPPRRKSGFTRGFAIVVLLVLLLMLVYANAPQIAESIPQADPYLSAFVAWIDKGRLWLDAMASGVQPGQ